MAAEKDGDPIDSMISPQRSRRADHPEPRNGPGAQPPRSDLTIRQIELGGRVADAPRVESRIEVRPIGTPLGLKELAALHKRTWTMLNVREKQVHMLLWPLALHFGLYSVKPGQTRKRPPLIAAFWARSLAEAPLTLGHLYPAALFKGLMASEVFEFGGMVVDPNFQHTGLLRTMSDTARLFLFSRRPKLIITNPVEPLYELYKQLGMKTVGNAPVEHPHAYNVKVWLMYGRFEELAKPYFM